MKRYIEVIIIFILIIILSGCKKELKVTFDYNCEGINNYTCNIVDKKINCAITIPECNEKKFIGWYDAKENGNKINIDADFNDSQTLYAMWNKIEEEEKYILIFDINGGVGETPTEKEIKYEEILPSISKSIPTKEGYTFTGWYDSSEYKLGKTYYNELNEPIRYYDKKENIVLYAGWRANNEGEIGNIVYKLIFDINGGIGETPLGREIRYNEKMPSISESVPTKEGYIFKGWYDNSDYTKGIKYYNEENRSEKYYDKEKDITLYAGWSKEQGTGNRIVFDLNGGNGGPKESISIRKGERLPQLTNVIPERKGYEFKGWYSSKGEEYYNSKGETTKVYSEEEDIRLYAKWEGKKYRITFNINRGTGSTPESVEAIYGAKVPQISSEIPTRSEYKFMGWYDKEEYTKGAQYYTETNIPARDYNKASDIVLYAGWSKRNETTYTVTFNANGGSGGQTGSIKVNKNAPMPSIDETEPKRVGYEFKGWYDSLSGGTMYYNSSCKSVKKYDKTSGMTLYARWEGIRYTISYNINGGTKGNNLPNEGIYDKVITINNPTKNFVIKINNSEGASISNTTINVGQEFKGWTSGSGLDIVNARYGNSTNPENKWENVNTKVKEIYFKNLRSTSGIVKLTANWEAKEVHLPSVTKDGNTCGYATSTNGNIVYKSGSSYKPSITTNKIELYVKCSKITYTITYNLNGGINPSDVENTYTSESTINLPIPSKDNYAFAGWYTNNNFNDFPVTKIKKGSSGNKTFYARWVNKNSYVVKYDCNGGSGAPKDEIITQGNLFVPAMNTCKKSGKEFYAWLNPEGNDWTFKAINDFKNGKYGIINNTLILKAQWLKGLKKNNNPIKPNLIGKEKLSCEDLFKKNSKNKDLKDVYCEYDRGTLKYTIIKPEWNYILTYIWMKDTYNQTRMAIATPKNPLNLSKRNLWKSDAIVKNEVKTKNYENKGFVGFNTNPMVSERFYKDAPDNWKYGPAIQYFKNDGQVLRNSVNNPIENENKYWLSSYRYIAGISNSGYLKYYTFAMRSNDSEYTEAKKLINSRIIEYVENDKIKDTFSWTGTYNILNYENGETTEKTTLTNQKNATPAICQIDLNNFIFITQSFNNGDIGGRDKRSIYGIDLLEIVQGLKCNTALRVDGGGSTVIWAKEDSSSDIYGPGRAYDKRNSCDILYFVEK